MGMNVLFYTRTKTDSPYTQVSEEELFRRSDYLTLHCPLTEETREIVNEKTLSLMQSSAVIVNTARGGLIDEKFLTHALNHDKIRGACLDVIAHEPMRADCPLRHAKHCIITPHVAWAPQDTRQRLERMVAETLRSFLNGTPVNTVVPPPREEQK
jgi:glycerate dehydrogenase